MIVVTTRKYNARVVGARTAAAKLRGMASNMVVFGSAFESIGQHFRDQVQLQFDLRGALPGIRGEWQRLSPVTIKLRGGSNRQLVRYHKLMNSWVNVANPFNISRIGMKTASFGSSFRSLSNRGKIVPLALWHQTGTSRMPARPVVLANRQLDEEILDAFVNQIFEGWTP